MVIDWEHNIPPIKETKMNTNRILLVLGAISMLLVTMAVSNPRANTSIATDQTASDFYQRHPEWTWSSREESSDYFQRHPELRMPGTGIDLTDYANRHPELSASANQPLAASDYFMRHPELTISVEASADLTDYFFRQELLSSGSSVDLTDYFFRHP
jgi:hypothetical protein